MVNKKTTPVDLSKLSDEVKNEVVKKTVYADDQASDSGDLN